jgi:hypothetical protein
MKTRMQLSPKVAPTLKINTSTIYVVGGVIVATLAGIVLFIYLNIGNNTESLAAAGTFSSRASGNWTSTSVWNGGTAPAAALDGDNITVGSNNAVLRSGSITGNNNVVLTIQSNATLTISGDFTVDNNLVLNNSGTLIITGNLVAKNGAGITVNGGGVMNVGGNATFDNNTNFIVNGNFTTGGNITFGNNALFNGAGTVKIVGSGCNQWSGTNACQSGPVILPVKLLRFDATDNGHGHVELSWATAMEKNNDYFTIQRSKDGVTYSDLTTTKGHGNTQEVSEYETEDAEPFAEKLYYRLSQTDFDGTTETFTPVLAEVKLVSQPISAYPNPFMGRNLTIQLPEASAGSLQIIDHRGDVILSRVTDGSSATIDIEFERDLPPGLYYVNYKTGEKTERLKIVKR